MTEYSKWPEIQYWIDKSEKLLVKKLSTNDTNWAYQRTLGPDNKKTTNQAGPYIPREIWESGFFPPLEQDNPEKPHIFTASFPTLWPSTGEVKSSRLKHYSNKGSEVHLTRVPKTEFLDLTPASILLGGILKEPEGDVHHWFIVIDSASEEAETLETIFDLQSDFHYGLFDRSAIFRLIKNDSDRLIEELSKSMREGTLSAFIASVSKLPPPEQLAAEAQEAYLKNNSLQTLDPYYIANPGDAIMEISRDIEYRIYKRYELRHRAAEVLRIVTTDGGDLVTSIVRGFPKLDATFLSASQHRKSRAGRSFEQHIGRLLTDGKVAFEEQTVTGGRRPDFVLPSLSELISGNRGFDDAMVLSAKTTLRERWKQVTLEKFKAPLYLATVDDRVSGEAVDDMGKQGIQLVVPESLKVSTETCYPKKDNVITFREFFDARIAARSSFFSNKT
jgi:hypothetical protein